MNKEQIIEAIKAMSVLELNELVKACEEEFGVSAAAPVAVAGAAAGAAEEEQTEFTVVLAEVGAEKIKVIKAVREITGLGLKEAKAVVDGAPSPIKEGVEKGEADIIISFEQLEAARYVSYLKKGGHIITSTQQIDPMPVITGAAVYPEDIIGKLKAEGVDVIAVDALALAEQAGTAKASNVVLMGVVSTKMAFDEDVWQKALENCVPAKFLELNKKAFALGREVK